MNIWADEGKDGVDVTFAGADIISMPKPDKTRISHNNETDCTEYTYKGIKHYSCGQEEVKEMIILLNRYEELLQEMVRYTLDYEAGDFDYEE